MHTSITPPSCSLLSEREALACEILYLLQDEPGITQRELARKVGVSLGRANACLRALAEKGWLEPERLRQCASRGRTVYVLTPDGMAERGRLAGRLLMRKRAQHAQLGAQIAQLEREVAAGRR